MGSFTEAVIAFEFRPEVPQVILRAFAPWQRGGPALEPVQAVDPEDNGPDTFERDDELAAVLTCLFGGMWNAYLPGEQSTVLVHEDHRWTLTSRFHWKDDPDVVIGFLSRLGPWACPEAEADELSFVGYVRHEYDDGPTLIWHNGEDFVFQSTTAPT